MKQQLQSIQSKACCNEVSKFSALREAGALQRSCQKTVLQALIIEK